VALSSQLAVCRQRVEQEQNPRPRFPPAFRMLWAVLSRVLAGWEDLAQLMKPATVKHGEAQEAPAAIDFFTVTTLNFATVHVFLVLEHGRRRVIHLAVTRGPSTAWVTQQLRNAMPWGSEPKYLWRDDDGIYGHGGSLFLEGCGVREVRTALQSPWQNPYVERFIGPILPAIRSLSVRSRLCSALPSDACPPDKVHPSPQEGFPPHCDLDAPHIGERPFPAS